MIQKGMVVRLVLYNYDMKTEIKEWTIEELYQIKDKIQDQPKYQRGKVWTQIKKQMLIDSIIRGIDIPKIYLRKLEHGLHDFEVADGQQRISAIKEIIDGKFTLSSKIINGLNLSKFGSYELGNKKITDLSNELKNQFLEYKLTIAKIEHASNEQIRILFARLQMGDTLNPAEKRNAIISKLGIEIDNLVLNHDFFTKSKISPNRFKRQDYIAHAIALIHYKNKFDLKAGILNKLYIELANTDESALIIDIVKILNWMHEIDKISKKKIINKWSFIDIFRFLHENKDVIIAVDYKAFADTFDLFEKNRILTKDPEQLLLKQKTTSSELNLYNYIIAFRTNGGKPQNLDKRLNTFREIFTPTITL